MKLKVKLLTPDAIAPTVAHPGEDLAYDLYALHDLFLVPVNKQRIVKVHTGIAIEFDEPGVGAIIHDRSSKAVNGLHIVGGVIDPGYRGEIVVCFSYDIPAEYQISKGDKVAQLRPVRSLTGEVEVVDSLSESLRGEKGFGSSGS